MGKWLNRLGSLTLVWQQVYKRENSEFKSVVVLESDGLCQIIQAQDMLHE